MDLSSLFNQYTFDIILVDFLYNFREKREDNKQIEKYF